MNPVEHNKKPTFFENYRTSCRDDTSAVLRDNQRLPRELFEMRDAPLLNRGAKQKRLFITLKQLFPRPRPRQGRPRGENHSGEKC